ncbi:CPBP family intramembrane glutamic endopeptidase [Leptothoe sp. PORK10 BA2]|uniref:CPBP family intramembrane glutamic endopeptidase n=1 Tax=Leptothoe sp. PORK10 BA2 TaxID=3110254 RepID=UPI002B1EA89D|nr:type II CAAX endopeptidase family protein [Leptothoe sp. PORK10 BA2]MEA5462243.1 type II CAAX endopeptidase family protein [Leptothoe sp. PORK10 BA2]
MIRWLTLYHRVTTGGILWRIFIFFVLLAALWAPLALVVYGAGYWFGQRNLASTIALIGLYSCFMVNAWAWGHWVHGWQRPFVAYGLIFARQFWLDALVALGVGVGLVACLFGLEVLFGWAALNPRPLLDIALEGLAVGIGIGLAEELLFRGWLLTELHSSISRWSAIIWSGMIFAIAHFIKPFSEVLSTSPQFLGLLLLGMILASGRYINRCHGVARPFTSLGLPIGFHAGLVWGYYIVDVADLVVPSGRVPEWVTGIHGNPLSGALGVTILGSIFLLSALKLRSE